MENDAPGVKYPPGNYRNQRRHVRHLVGWAGFQAVYSSANPLRKGMASLEVETRRACSKLGVTYTGYHSSCWVSSWVRWLGPKGSWKFLGPTRCEKQ